MTNEQLIKSAHVWGLAVLLACGVIAVAATSLKPDSQNSNSSTQNQNSNSNRNSNSRSNENMSGSQMATAGLSSGDRKFAMEAAMGGMMEVELGKMAAKLFIETLHNNGDMSNVDEVLKVKLIVRESSQRIPPSTLRSK